LCLVSIEQPPGQPDHHRKQKRGRAEEQHEQSRKMCADGTDEVRERARLAGRRERWIVAIVGRERREDDQRKRTEDPKRAFAQRAHDGCTEPRSSALHLSSRRQWTLPQLVDVKD